MSPSRLLCTSINGPVIQVLLSSISYVSGTATLLNPAEGPPKLPSVHILPPLSTPTPTLVPLVVPALNPTTDPCGDNTSQPAIFSPTASTVPGAARPAAVGGSQIEIKGKELSEVLTELSLESEEALLSYVKEGLKAAAESVKDLIQVLEITPHILI